MKYVIYLFSVILFFIAFTVMMLPVTERIFVNDGQVLAKNLLMESKPGDSRKITYQDMLRLPPVVRRWIIVSGALNKNIPTTIRLKQKGGIRLSMDQDFMPLEAEEYFRIDKPGFVWIARVPVFPGIAMIGVDQLDPSGSGGSMKIRLAGLVSLIDASGAKLTEGAMLRYLSEIIWFPQAAVSPFIQWKATGFNSAEAALTYNGITVTGEFIFRDDGHVSSFKARRYREVNGEFVLDDWFITSGPLKTMEGMTVAGSGTATWSFSENRQYDYFQGTITEIQYNPANIYSSE